MPSVAQYYPGDFWGDLKQTLNWIYWRQSGPVGNWQASAAATPTAAPLAECGIVSSADLSAFATAAVENIVIDAPAGVLPDATPGPDGFPINFSPRGLATGNVFVNTFQNTGAQTVTGRCFSLLQPAANYRVDVFARTDQFYYQASSGLTDAGGGVATWSVAPVMSGSVIAVLYPAAVPPPPAGAGYPALPAGWVAHSNMGVGPKLSAYFARLYVKTDIEYLQEDQIPIIVQDSHHARSGSSRVPASGVLTLHIVYNDPVAGPTPVYSSLQNLAAYQGLPRSFIVPTSDPLYVPDVTATNAPALQNRSFIYDAALFILTCSEAGNFTAASKVIRQLNQFLDHPGYLASLILENAEDGSTARWSATNGSVTNMAASSVMPQEPPYGTGNILQFHASAAGASFAYVGAGLPDPTDSIVSFEHREAAALTNQFQFDIGITTSSGRVTDVALSPAFAAPAAYNSATKTISVPIAPADSNWHTTLVALGSLVQSLAGDTLTSVNTFKVTLNAVGDLYFDNLSVGGPQPDGSLSFSYDVYYGQVDQAYIRTGAMAWVCYAYALYMQMSLDFSPALYLQRMLNFLLTLQSTAADLTQGMLYAGYGRYQDPGYQFVPGLQATVSTEHQVDAYFAFVRAAAVLPAAATELLKTGAITGAQATSLNATARQVASAAATIQAQVLAHLYIPPAADPGHFAAGVTANTLDTSQALDASGTWSALLCHAAGDDAKALQCLQFVYQKFYVTGQTIVKSNLANTWNQAYAQSTPFGGFKPYNDSPGGYSGSPVSVWQEGTWGVILALLALYNAPGVSAYFASVEGSLDSFLAKLVAGQRTVRATTGDGSLLGYSLASRGLPYEFEVWPMLAPTCWQWLTSVNPTLLLSTATNPQPLPYLFIPDGQGQTASELDGASTVSALTVECIDPGDVVKALASQPKFIGKTATLKMGFPEQALGDFVVLETRQITATGWTADGRITFETSDVQRFMQGAQIWSNGGPGAWAAGQPAPPQPSGAAVAANAFPVSEQNPRWLAANPLDIYLVAMQNELGVGQDPSVPPPFWAQYEPGDDTTLINPNPYLDVPGILRLRDGMFSGDWFEFKITRPVEGKQWLEDQILKVLGLYTVVRAGGQLSLKSMKSPEVLSPVMALDEDNIIGIPAVTRLPIINSVTVRFGVDDTVRETAARQYQHEITYQQGDSVTQYRQHFKHRVEANGLRLERGGLLRSFLLADRIFRRHAFGTPQYQVRAMLSALPVEVGDFVWLSHRLVPDFLTGQRGLTNVVGEVIDRKPHYASGLIEFGLLDTRFMRMTSPFGIAAAGVPAYSAASPAQRRQLMFVSSAANGGLNPDGSPGHAIF